MTPSKHILHVAVLAIFVVGFAVRPMASAAETTPSKKLVLTGTIGSISQVDPPQPSTKNWEIYFHVEKVKVGKYSDSTITFRIHSPACAGLKLGGRYTIEAAWTGQEYEVSERNITAEGAKR
jgi:hypothetical protein